MEAELAPMSATATPGSTVWVALRQKLDDGWHSYWRNEGDAGGPTEIKWTLPEGWSAGDILWPAPQRIRTQQLMSYGFTGEVLLPTPLQVPADAKPGDVAHLTAHADFFVCSDTLCVPEQADLALDVKVAEGPAAPDATFGQAVADALAAAPKPAGLHAAVQLQNGSLKLAAWGGPLTGADAAGAYFFPYERGVIAHAAEQTIERGPEGLTLTLKPDARFTGVTGPIAGVLATKAGAWEITAVPGAAPAIAAGKGPAPSADQAGATAAPRAGLGVATAVLFALLGGLLLNLMPCVFPVLSMKAAHLAERAHAPGAARRDALVFLAGVVVTFLALAGVLIAAKAAGQAVGWGFQLQSPWATAFLSLLMLSVALNLSGVFELGTSVQGAGADLQRREGALGAFFTGALAVVVAAPCSAPFMATAMGAALAQGPVLTFAVFTALGLGLALPFVGLSFSPALLRRLPKPGPWMDALRRLLAFPMYAAAAWMAWVFARQSGDFGLAFLFGAALALALALHLYGRAQHAQGRRALLPLGGAGVAFAAAIFLGVWGAAAEPSATPAEAAATATPSEPFAPARLARLRAEGRPVLVNFTADWCVTCKVNERVLEAGPVKAAFARTGVVYMVADWTRRDDVIAAALAEQGRSGVPLYLLYRSGEAEPVVLPQLLTEGALIDALEGAA
ncbi:thioredoxin family protein [Caulobacter sp. 17J80-11]|nr:protein-disulfide reductase DsbD domain-containing protein [Caulobacter sp. 17J80-11]MBC6980211.1 thioredoxin family protein [Caulobacter sp. 17J80-11]